MIITGNKVGVSDGTFELEAWLRAPLFLGEGVPYFSAMPSQPKGTEPLEIIFTTIDPEQWGDLWRIEFETEDTPGNAAMLQNLLADRGFATIHWESVTDTLSDRHQTSVIVFGGNYESDRDLSCRERMRAKNPELFELREDIIIYFWDQLCIDRDGSVRLKIRPMQAHRRLYDDYFSRKRFLSSPRNAQLFAGSVTISDRGINTAKRFLKCDELSVYPTVDTKERLIRATIVDAPGHRISHFAFSYIIEEQNLISAVYNRLFAIGANIITSQVRPAPSKPTSPGDDAYFEDQFRLVDITFELNPVGRPTERDDQRKRTLDEFGQWFESLPAVASQRASVRATSW